MTDQELETTMGAHEWGRMEWKESEKAGLWGLPSGCA